MSTMTATMVPTLPENAPFSPAQRAWLNGFFAGLFSSRSTMSVSPVAAAASASARAIVEEETFPWHDPALGMDERLKLAEGKPRERMMMAAMAQLDCGACGYLCQTYAEALVQGTEKDLTRCAPGGRDTSRKLKELIQLGGAAVATPAKRVTAPPAAVGFDRLKPFAARLLVSEPLNQAGSSKDTRLVAFDLKGSGIAYQPGDSLGVWPENCSDTVTWILEALDAAGSEKVPAPDGSLVRLRDALTRHYVVTNPSEGVVELMASAATNVDEAAEMRQMISDDGPGIAEGYEVLDLLTQFPSARPALEDFAAALAPLQPRLYSISSSLKAHPEQVHLTVGVVRFLNCRGRQCKGVASSYLADRVRAGQKVRIFIQQSHGFRLPTAAETPVIMVGPGTGVAPFRAFLQERKMSGGNRNWLFFGDQKSDVDFLYRDELEGYAKDGVLSRLSTAFSRDQERKVYVQHRMLEAAADIWDWIQQGAHFYVCGDAKRMAADVDNALKQIVAEHGKMSADEAKAFVANLSKGGRYQRDVY
ncbi:MAG TPA: sulfite reductase subunit alpha [Tepidisphaeraceae bacterium]|jgi:sulfite reductase (NADPH) flavoprotein alpha-component